jgi:aminoglycoside 2''-phosphotransferase
MLTRQPLAVYQAVINEKFPQLEVKKIEYLAEGWESVACVVNEEFIFRFPKTPGASRYLGVEMQLLPELAGYLPLPIPRFEYVSKTPSSIYPFSFVGYKMIEGDFLEAKLEELENAKWWQPILGNFITVLHTFPLDKASSLGVSEIDLIAKMTGRPPKKGVTWHENLTEFYELSREKAYPLLPQAVQANITKRFEDFLNDPRHFEFTPVLLHADFSPDHILIDLERQKINGVIDFGDAGIGDPALDCLWMDDFLPYYKGEVDATFKARYDFYAEIFELFMIIYGQIHADQELVEEGIAEVEATFS